MKKLIIAILFLTTVGAFASQDYFQEVEEAATYLKERVGMSPKLLIVLTAGIRGPLDLLEDVVEVSSAEIPHFPIAQVEGHDGKLFFGKFEGIDIVLMKGRYHFYEGISAQRVVFPYFVLNKLGVESVITMNAVGGVRHDLDAGDIVLVEDHINLIGDNPLKGVAIHCPENQFPDMTEPYDLEYRQIAQKLADQQGVELKTGIYAAVSGPNYETKAEIKMYRTVGVDLIGMSTIFEVIACRFLDMRVLAFCCVTNPAADRHEGNMTHAEVLEALDEMNPRLSELVTSCARKIARL